MMRVAAIGAAALIGGRGAVSICVPADDPYITPHEASPFGWPLAPAYDQNSECWAEQFPKCGGSLQSPMAIGDSTCPLIDGDAASSMAGTYKFIDQGTMVKVSKYMGSLAIVSGESLGTISLEDYEDNTVKYEAHEVHVMPVLHNSIGSAVIDKGIEILVVHRPKGKKDGLSSSVVVSYIFKEGDCFNNTQFALPEDSQRRSDFPTASSMSLQHLHDSFKEGASYSYEGSEPVPPCSETVTWIVKTSDSATVCPDQVAALTAHLQEHKALRPRPVSTCTNRNVYKNSNKLFHHTASCDHAPQNGTAACWNTCAKSPIDIHTDGAKAAAAQPFTGMSHYKKSGEVHVKPSKYTLDATGDFGHIVMNGKMFKADKISVKPIAAHTIDGVRYAGEIMIEHSMYGDDIETISGRRLEAHSESEGHHNEGHKVIVSILLTNEGENPLLRDLGLGGDQFKATIKDSGEYIVNNVDLAFALGSAFEGDYEFYSGGSIFPGCSSWGTRWIVFHKPMSANLEQLNFLALHMSGVDSTRMPVAAPEVYKSYLPANAIDKTGHCDTHNTGEHWNYDEIACWISMSAICGAGEGQSPISIDSSSVASTGSAVFLNKVSYRPLSGAKVTVDKKSMKVESGQLGYMEYIDPSSGFPHFYQVTDVLVHMPSEHMIDGKQFPAEVQIIHKKQNTITWLEERDQVGASIMLDFGEENPFLAQMLGALGDATPSAHSESHDAGHRRLSESHDAGHSDSGSSHSSGAHGGKYTPMGPWTFSGDQEGTFKHPLDLMRAFGPVLEAPFFRYDGSSTTPPCDAAVKWFVFPNRSDTGRPMTLSKAQWEAFKTFVQNPANNRPVQPNSNEVFLNDFAEGVPAHYDFFLQREFGRNRRELGGGYYVIMPIIGTLVLMFVVMAADFQAGGTMEDNGVATGDGRASAMGKSAGGLDSEGMQTKIGKSTKGGY